jgi:hypothetical protein
VAWETWTAFWFSLIGVIASVGVLLWIFLRFGLGGITKEAPWGLWTGTGAVLAIVAAYVKSASTMMALTSALNRRVFLDSLRRYEPEPEPEPEAKSEEQRIGGLTYPELVAVAFAAGRNQGLNQARALQARRDYSDEPPPAA